MAINTQDTNKSIGGIIINTKDTYYSIGGMIIDTQNTDYSTKRWSLTLKTLITPLEGW